MSNYATSLPPSHPNVHKHQGMSCPVTGETHDFCPPQPGDSRAPCPALNTMANHGYISRDGKNIGISDVVNGLKACYGLSTFLSYFLILASIVALRKLPKFDLFELGIHNRIEHDASLVHADTPEGSTYAPIDIHQELVDALIADVKCQQTVRMQNGLSGVLMDYVDVARARVRREKECRPVSFKGAEIARGEMGVILGVWEMQSGDKKGIPVEWVREWIGHERLPQGWRPTHEQGFFDVVKRVSNIRSAMKDFREKEAQDNTLEKAKKK